MIRTLSRFTGLIDMSRFFIIVLILVSGTTYGQQFSAGASFGVNASQVSGDGYSGFNKAGISAGIFSNTKFTEKFDFQFEINFSEKGSRKNARPDKDDNDFFLLRMPYIEIPLMLQYHKKKFTYEAGFSYSRLLSYHLEDEDGVLDLEPQLNQFNNSDFSFLLGINFDLTEHLKMNWRFNSSIIPFRKYDSGGRLLFDSGMYHHYIVFTLRYQFIGTER